MYHYQLLIIHKSILRMQFYAHFSLKLVVLGVWLFYDTAPRNGLLLFVSDATPTVFRCPSGAISKRLLPGVYNVNESTELAVLDRIRLEVRLLVGL